MHIVMACNLLSSIVQILAIPAEFCGCNPGGQAVAYLNINSTRWQGHNRRDVCNQGCIRSSNFHVINYAMLAVRVRVTYNTALMSHGG